MRLETRPTETTANSSRKKKQKGKQGKTEACLSHPPAHPIVKSTLIQVGEENAPWRWLVCSSKVARLIASPATNMHQALQMEANQRPWILFGFPEWRLEHWKSGSVVALLLRVSAELCQIAHVVCCSSSG